MTNLLAETLWAVGHSGHAPSDVTYVGSVGKDPHGCTWADFERLADVEYDSGYGGAEVAGDLMVVFSDGSWLERAEYDGSEWWEFKKSPQVPPSFASISRLIRASYESSLAEMNKVTS